MDMEKEYDGLNHRIVRGSRLEGTKTNYLFGRNGAVVSEKCAKNGGYALRDFYYLNDQVILFKDYVENSFERLCYPVTDIQGSVYEIYSSEGKLLWKMNYGSYGDADGAITDLIGDFSRNQSEALSFNGMYTGSQRDRETSLIYHWNRWQSEDGLTWLTQDPARDGSNWYGYCGNSPLNFVDTTGLERFKRNEDGSITNPGPGENIKQPPKNEPSTETPDIPEQSETGIDITIPTPEIQQFGMGVLMGIEDSITHLKNVDFGRDYIYDATRVWRNGNYLQAAIYELDATSEIILDLGFAYVGAQIYY